MKTASRILGSAFFTAGYEVQDAPRYGAERRGAPMFAYVRANGSPIRERGIIDHPDLVVVADDSLVSIPGAGVMQGLAPRTVLLINSPVEPEIWRQRLNFAGPIVGLPASKPVGNRAELPFVGSACAGAAARLVGVIDREALGGAVERELEPLGDALVTDNRAAALQAYDEMAEHAGTVSPGDSVGARDYQRPDWISLPFDSARISAPDIHAPATSVEVRTGLWRTMRPVIDYERCNRCWWVCSNFCPDSAINVGDDKQPVIDYDHCKGCMICVAKCPPHAIEAIPENVARAAERETTL